MPLLYRLRHYRDHWPVLASVLTGAWQAVTRDGNLSRLVLRSITKSKSYWSSTIGGIPLRQRNFSSFLWNAVTVNNLPTSNNWRPSFASVLENCLLASTGYHVMFHQLFQFPAIEWILSSSYRMLSIKKLELQPHSLKLGTNRSKKSWHCEALFSKEAFH